ncbi:MAG: hypothetical protein Q9226_005664 [Calogaya cf. arnoldii]
MFYTDNKDTHEPKTWFAAQTIVFDKASMLQRPHLMLPIISFVDAIQILLTGDPRQLSGLIINKETRKIWPDSFILQFMQNGFPWIMLDVQYRMHDELYAHLIVSIYNTIIGSKKLTANPSPFLQNLLEHPTQVIAGGNIYVLNSFLHFIDVEDGQQESKEAGSSWNNAEIDVIDALVRALLGRQGIEKGDIMVIVGYKEQRKLLKKKARENGWLDWVDIKWIGTIDSTQGSQAKIVCLGLVTTHGLPHFMGDGPRANVATSRQQEALYIVGKRDYWFRQLTFNKRKLVMHDILAFMDKTAAEKGRGPFVVQKQGSIARPQIEYPEVITNIGGLSLAPSTSPTAKAKGKGREMDLPAVEKARRNLAEVQAEASQSMLAGEDLIQEEVKRFRQAEESRLESIRIRRGLDKTDEEFEEMEHRSEVESKKLLSRLIDEQEDLNKAFDAELACLRVDLWEQEIFGKFYGGIAHHAFNVWPATVPKNFYAISIGTIKLFIWSEDSAVRIGWDFVHSFATAMVNATERGFVSLLDATFVHVVSGVMIHVKLIIAGRAGK